jgi:Lanthionine synthetase C-like protein
MASDFSSTSTWPPATAVPGLAHGWHGHAWIWLWLVRAGLAPDRRQTRNAIAERLRRGGADHAASHLVGSGARPLIAALAARVDDRGLALAEQAIAEWTRQAMPTDRPRDVLCGTAGALLAAAEIEALLPGRVGAAFPGRLHHRCERELARLVERAANEPVYLGLAHGLVGYLLALETGRRAFDLAVPATLRRRALGTLERNALRTPGGGAMWPARSLETGVNAHGWCSGGPGIALGIAACHALTGRRDYRVLAVRALDGVAEVVNRHPSTCCGMLGQIQVLIEAARLLDDDRWLRHARRLRRGLSPARPHDPALARGLWKGAPGYDFVAWRIAHPDRVPFPGLGVLSIADLRPTARDDGKRDSGITRASATPARSSPR